jgi:hypothetical protein
MVLAQVVDLMLLLQLLIGFQVETILLDVQSRIPAILPCL